MNGTQHGSFDDLFCDYLAFLSFQQLFCRRWETQDFHINHKYEVLPHTIYPAIGHPNFESRGNPLTMNTYRPAFEKLTVGNYQEALNQEFVRTLGSKA